MKEKLYFAHFGVPPLVIYRTQEFSPFLPCAWSLCFTRYHMRLVRHRFWLICYRTTTNNNWIAVRRLFFWRTIRKILYYCNLVQTNDVAPFIKTVSLRKKQHISEFWSIQALSGFFKIFSKKKCNSSALIHTKETSM